MRTPRIKAAPDETGVYHCTSRIVGSQFLLDDACRSHLAQLVLRLAQFCGVQPITLNILDNHFHVLIRIRPPQPICGQELLQRLESFYGKEHSLCLLIRSYVEQDREVPDFIMEPLLKRFSDVSNFMKELKQRFSRWYNLRHQRKGTLWAERFTCSLIEDSSELLKVTAGYIDLNAVRAGIVRDPKDYRDCGYSAALAGNEVYREGIRSVIGKYPDWEHVAAEYRMLIFTQAGRSGASNKVALDREQIANVMKNGGELTLGEVLQVRIRHLSAGVVLGSREYVEKVYTRYRANFGPNRRCGARPIRKVPIPGFYALRDLQKNIIG